MRTQMLFPLIGARPADFDADCRRVVDPSSRALSREPARARGRACRNGNPAGEQETSYLALNWQRAEIGLPHTSRDRRFPTPQPTTNHLLLQHLPGNIAPLLPISQPNSNSLGGKCKERAKGGGGDHAHAVVESAISISSSGKIYSKWAPASLCCSKKLRRALPQQDEHSTN